MYLIDTNIHTAYLLQNYEEDKLTKKYLELYNDIALNERVIPDFILSEFETFIIQVVPSRYKLNGDDKQQLKKLSLDYIHRLTHECTLITPEIQILNNARDLYFENVFTHYLSFVDCLVLSMAREHRYSILTKDARMITVAKQLNIITHEPLKA